MEDTRRYSFQPPESAIGPPTRYIFSPSFTVNAVGSIPARAGEPSRSPGWAARSTVYPRACGGTFASVCSRMCIRGLSPRVRGNHPDRRVGQRGLRSIPARAGEPSQASARACASGVYPRACGGTIQIAGLGSAVYGLSPRVRGNLRKRLLAHVHPGSIPARAGEPSPRISRATL